ncbi:helix-turn-helix transcriptional regulator [Streptomyces sp. NPDC102395]|uniref:helix-turn-helix transcriptional regulator n=1 Tax=Streptomyces sp. NPDC102395 TaxID=3366168 RepID=UPI003803F891
MVRPLPPAVGRAPRVRRTGHAAGPVAGGVRPASAGRVGGDPPTPAGHRAVAGRPAAPPGRRRRPARRWPGVRPFPRRVGTLLRHHPPRRRLRPTPRIHREDLTRACSAATGQPVKHVIDGRVALEAQRLLAHTDEPVAAVARHLGFLEPTNFGKLFTRHTGVTPGAFRLTHQAAALAPRPRRDGR